MEAREGDTVKKTIQKTQSKKTAGRVKAAKKTPKKTAKRKPRGLGPDIEIEDYNASLWRDLKTLRNPPVTFKALNAVKVELKSDIRGLEHRMRGEFTKVRQELRQEIAEQGQRLGKKIDDQGKKLSSLEQNMSKMMAGIESMQASMASMQARMEENDLRSGAVLDTFSVMREKLDTNAHRLNEDTNRRLDLIEYAVKEMHKHKRTSEPSTL